MSATRTPGPLVDYAVDRVNLNSIVGKRYQMDLFKNMICDKFQVINNSVDPQTAQQLEKLLAGKQTDVVILNDGSTAKLVILNTPDKGPRIHQMDVRAELTLGKTYLGDTFTEQDKQYLHKYGDMGRPAQLIDPNGGQPFKALIGVDQETRRLRLFNIDTFRMPDEILGKKLTPVQKLMLLEGKALRLDNMDYKGTKFSAYTRLSAAKGGFKYNKIQTQQNNLPLASLPSQVQSISSPAPQPSNQKLTPVSQSKELSSSTRQSNVTANTQTDTGDKPKPDVKKSKVKLRR